MSRGLYTGRKERQSAENHLGRAFNMLKRAFYLDGGRPCEPKLADALDHTVAALKAIGGDPEDWEPGDLGAWRK